MLLRKMISVAFAISLSGCAVAFHAANGTLGDVAGKPAMPVQVQVNSFGDGTGFQPVRSIEVPADVCDKDALVEGYKNTYVQNWNEFVNAKIRQFSPTKSKNKVKARPADKADALNLALYKTYVIGASKNGAPKQTSKIQSNADTCKSTSFNKGANLAQGDVEDQRKEVISKEVK